MQMLNFMKSLKMPNFTWNGDEIESNCRNRYISFIGIRIIVKISGLLEIWILDFNKFEIQLSMNSIDLVNSDYVYVKENKDVDEVVVLDIFYYVF